MLSVEELLTYATDGDTGRSESDPVYREITENRDTGKAYSSCADLAHWMYERLGMRGPWLNRASLPQGFRYGVNVSRLAYKCPEARAPHKGEQFETGDVLIVWNREDTTDAHVLVVREHSPGVIDSADYGQPGGARRRRGLLVTSAGNMILGGRRVQRVLRLREVVRGAVARGELAQVEEVLK
jgi:hypothetical protein